MLLFLNLSIVICYQLGINTVAIIQVEAIDPPGVILSRTYVHILTKHS